jgi:phosphohistidine phosphatase SixA
MEFFGVFMRLYLARHGQAASPEPGASAGLTAQGRTDVTLVAQELAGRKLNIQQIWYSPKTRTQQTAGIYAEILKVDPSHLMKKETLLIDGDINLLYEDILESQKTNLLLVSHEPLLNELASLLAGDRNDLSSVFFPTSGVAAFEKSLHWKRLWLLEPSALR